MSNRDSPFSSLWVLVMRSRVLRDHIRRLSQVACLVLVAGLASGCSSNFSRFDRDLYSALPQSNQQANTQQTAQNSYPGDVDPTTTAGIDSGGPIPVSQVSTPRVAPDYSGYQPGNQQSSTYGTGATYPTALSPSQYSNGQASDPAGAARSGVVSASLPAPKNPGIDPISTQSVPKPPVASAPVAQTASVKPPNGIGGWSGAGGNSVTIQSGETLYNLSKRYGVPVNEIMKANGIENANDIHVGQRVTIPTYVYSSKAPISAPDNDPGTKAALSSRGFNAGTSGIASAGDIYIVESGDTLSGIASRTNTTVATLKSLNGLDDTTIKVGQTLKVAGKVTSTQVASLKPTVPISSAANEKPKTGSASSETSGELKPNVKPSIKQTQMASVQTTAPASSGIDQLRWPVKGRIISSFGDSRGGEQNDGIDISVPEGTAVKAAENGVVIYAGDELEGFGNLILVRHSGGYVTAYAHNKSNLVSKGETINRGQTIANSGRTGSAQVPMLHFEVRKNSKPVDPVKYLGG